MAFVLTGKDDWKQWSRDHIEQALDETDSDVHVKIQSMTDILVSSRFDTVKARTAASMGCEIITYAELHGALSDGRITRNQFLHANNGVKPVSVMSEPPMTPVIDMAPMEVLPGWGSF